MFAIKVSSLIKNWAISRFHNFEMEKWAIAIEHFEFQFKFNLLELLSQGESDSLIKT